MARILNQGQENYYVNRGLTPLPQPNITGMKLAGDITLGDFIFNSIDDLGVTWVVTEIEGWWAHPAADTPSIERAIGDGGYDVVGRYKARTLTFEGSFFCPNPNLVEDARDRFIAATNLVYDGAWLKTGSNPKRASFVRLSGTPNISTTTARGRTDFSVGLRAADPIKYEWNDADPEGYSLIEIPAKDVISGSSGSETVTNIGNYRAPVYLEIAGPIVSPATIYNRTTDQLILIVSPVGGVQRYRVESKQLTFDENRLVDVATLKFNTTHDFKVGYEIDISGVDSGAQNIFNGSFVVTDVPDDTSISYEPSPSAAIIKDIFSKKLLNGVATLGVVQAVSGTEIQVGSSIIVSAVDAVFNGTHTVTAISLDKELISFNKTRVPAQTVISRSMVSNVATLTTQNDHGLIVGETVSVSGVDAVNFDTSVGLITAIPSPQQFSYAATRTDSKSVVKKSMTNDIVTLTTGANHGFFSGELVSINNCGESFNGSYLISSITDASFTYKKDRNTTKLVTLVSRVGNVATITTSSPHGISIGENVTVSDITSNTSFNVSNVVVTSIPSDRNISFFNTGADTISTVVNSGSTITPKKREVIRRSILGNIATLVTQSSHGLFIGDRVGIYNVGSPWNTTTPSGFITVKGVPTANTFTFDLTSANFPEGPMAEIAISTRVRVEGSNIMTVSTASAHGLSVDQRVTINGLDTSNNPKVEGSNGIFNVLSVINSQSFTYTSTKNDAVPDAAAAPGATATGVGYIEWLGTIAESTLSGASIGSARVSGEIVFSTSSGLVTPSSTIGTLVGGVVQPLNTSGNVSKTNNVAFTPGVSAVNTAVVAYGPEILEIDTKTRDVFYNGLVEGARAKIDVLADFIYLAPGENIIEFEDNGSPISNALLKVNYRSGWLG